RTVVEVLPQGQAQFSSSTDWQRSYASQIFQMTAVNVHWTHHHLLDGFANKIASAGQILYEQRETSTGGDGAPDSGERLMDYSYSPPSPPKEIMESGSTPGRPIDHPNFTAGALSELSTRISTRNDGRLVLAHESAKLPNTVTFNDESQFERVLARAARDGNLPAILEVHTANEPFWSDSGGSAAGGNGSWHVLAVTAYDAKN